MPKHHSLAPFALSQDCFTAGCDEGEEHVILKKYITKHNALKNVPEECIDGESQNLMKS